MELHADLNERAIAFSEDIPWIDSPMPGVQRRMLERDGAEVARATSIVRYAPGSHFSPHTHGGGEEFLVLEGVFSDEHGDYPTGTYIRNPVGSTHTPSSQDGCTILVKLWQMHPDDQQRVAVDTARSPWLPGLVEGLQVMPLHSFGSEQVALVKWAPGTHFQPHRHWGGEEIFVLKGVFEDELGRYPKGTWIRNPSGSMHTPFSREGCLIYVKTGHLSEPLA
ncbi:cupin domain-containing protein [Oscillatoria sp. FACHB-1407]|uniref:cupin domain-containing protein n=1 Tax=Oscillatoria sp. FACHB-1407 TaxID=2692847 RepID=UPI001689B6BE|nr:cupin domain-containing protein [Oscillatoria sp. FACHB-1407]MBD2461899.1 cupin domain-containing protein [Oscillatoria sp. FACHB-1407]